MKTRLLAQMLGVVVGLLAVLGLASGDEHLLGLMNIDLTLDIIRIPVAAALLYAGFWAADNLTINNIVLGVGVLYIGMGVLGLMSPELFGLLPHGLTGFDVAFHLVSGLVATAAGMMHRSHHGSPLRA